MNLQEKQLLVSRILFGAVRCKIDDTAYYVSSPTDFHVFVANEIYAECLSEPSQLLTEEEVVDYLCSIGLWSEAEEDELDAYVDNLEKIKLELYDYRFNKTDFGMCKLRIKKLRDRFLELLNKKHSYDHVSIEGLATLSKMNYLIGSGLRDCRFELVWRDNGFLYDDHGLLEDVRLIYQRTRMSEAIIRELARTDPWRTYWMTCDRENIFGRKPLELTEEQKALVSWTKLYDSIFESLEPPEDFVVEDDDLLDAWLVLQRKKRAEDKEVKRREEFKISKNPKINNAQQVFIMVGEDKDPITGKNIQLVKNIDEARELDNIINSDQAKRAKQARFKSLDNVQGIVKHSQLEDVQRDLSIQYNNQIIERRKQTGI